MLPSDVPAAVLIQMADGAPTSPTPPLPAPLRAPRGRRIELPSDDAPSMNFGVLPTSTRPAAQALLH